MSLFGLSKSDIDKMYKNKDVEGLSKALENKDEDIKKNATFALIRFLTNLDNELRHSAANALTKAKGSPAVESVIDALTSKTALIGMVIGQISEEDEFSDTLTRKYEEARGRAISGLGKIGDPRAVAPLIEFMRNKDNSEELRGAALLSLCEIGDANIIESVLQFLRDCDNTWSVFFMKKVAVALGRIGEAAIEPLIECLRFWGGFYSTEEEVTEALIKIGKPAIEPLVHALQSKDKFIRDGASGILEKLGWKPA